MNFESNFSEIALSFQKVKLKSYIIKSNNLVQNFSISADVNKIKRRSKNKNPLKINIFFKKLLILQKLKYLHLKV